MMAPRVLLCAAMIAGGTHLCAGSSYALQPSDVLVLYNQDSPEGAAIASYYGQVHPGVRLLSLRDVPVAEQVGADVYLNQIRPQVLAGLDSSIDVIVTTKGLPLRIDAGTSSVAGWSRYSSLESELTRIDSISTRNQMGGQAWYLNNPLAANPYYNQKAPFARAAYNMRLASRLDGFSVADVEASVDRAQRAVIGRPGLRFVLDDDPNASGAGADRIQQLGGNVLAPRGLAYSYDATDAFVADSPGLVSGYVGHGTNGDAPADYLRNTTTGLRFSLAPGAVFHTWESYNAYTFAEGASHPAQGLVADWLRRGGTVGTGHVQEPGVSVANVTNEDRMFEMLLSGYSWAESAWNATRQLSYVNTVVGDPLMTLRPWAQGDADLDGDVDADDLAVVAAAYGTASGDALYSLMADMNADGVVDAWDFACAQTRSGDPLRVPSMPITSGATTVPEPSAITLVALAGAAAAARRRKAGLPA